MIELVARSPRPGPFRQDHGRDRRTGARKPLRAVLLSIACLALAATTAADPLRELFLIRLSRPAPDFTVPSLGTRPVTLRDFAGKVILLNFWATWCPPCKREMPSMERLYQRYQNRGFTILAISIDATGATAVEPFVKSLGLTFPVGLDPGMQVANLYRVRQLPSTFIIDSSGKIVAIGIGPWDWDSPAAQALVDALLK